LPATVKAETSHRVTPREENVQGKLGNTISWIVLNYHETINQPK